MSTFSRLKTSLESADGAVIDSIINEALQDAPLEEVEEARLLEEQTSGIVALESDEVAISQVTKAMDVVANATEVVKSTLDNKGIVQPETLAILNATVEAIAPSSNTTVSMEAEGDEAQPQTSTGEGDKTPTDGKATLNKFSEKVKELIQKFIAWMKDIGKRLVEFFNKERILIKGLKGKIAQLITKARQYSHAEINVGGITQLGDTKVDISKVAEELKRGFTEADNRLNRLITNAAQKSDTEGMLEANNKAIGNMDLIKITSGRGIRVRSQDNKFFVIEQVAKDFKPSEEKIKLDRNTYVNSLRSVLSMLQLAEAFNTKELKVKAMSEKLARDMEAAAKDGKEIDRKFIDFVKSLRNATPRVVAALRIEGNAIYSAFAGATFTGGDGGAKDQQQA